MTVADRPLLRGQPVRYHPCIAGAGGPLTATVLDAGEELADLLVELPSGGTVEQLGVRVVTTVAARTVNTCWAD